MKILVTGGAGFIGSNFIHHIINKHPDYQIICVDKLTYAGNIRNLDIDSIIHNPNFKFIHGDICDRNLMYSVFETERPDVVVNF